MSSKTFSVSIAQEQINALARGLSKTEIYNLSDKEIETLLSIAVHNWIDTLLGPRRFRTMTELYVAWLRDIHTRHLTDEEPNDIRLFTRLGFPYGQASYIARVLLMEQPLTTRQKSLSNLQTALTAALTRVKENKWNKEKLEIERVKITVSKGSRKELDAILDVLTKRGVNVHPTKIEGTMGSYQVILVIAADLQILVTEVGKLVELVSTRG
ncbi:MAG: hypothetical protein ACOYZ8_09825 [Chloroflexota bacterium]